MTRFGGGWQYREHALTIHDSCTRSIAFCIVAFFAYPISGCDWERPYANGRFEPDFRFKVTLSEPQSKADLFMRFEELAELTGFPNYQGLSITNQMLEHGTKLNTFSWYPDEKSTVRYSITLGWRPRSAERPTWVLVIFRMGTADRFTEKEWLIFEEWKESYLPKVFPDAAIEVDRHPAVRTNKEEMLEISRATGIPIPQDLLEKYTRNSEGI